MSLAVTITNSSQGILSAKEMFLIRPRGIGLRTVEPYNIPGKLRSSIYKASPVTFLRPSLREIDLPTRDFSFLVLIRVTYFTTDPNPERKSTALKQPRAAETESIFHMSFDIFTFVIWNIVN